MDPSKKSLHLEDLYRQKVQKLAEQKALSDKMNEILTKKGGLNESSLNAKRNLLAAIAVSTQAGCKFSLFLTYYVYLLT